MKWYGEDEATANAKIDAIKAQGESDENLRL